MEPCGGLATCQVCFANLGRACVAGPPAVLCGCSAAAMLDIKMRPLPTIPKVKRFVADPRTRQATRAATSPFMLHVEAANVPGSNAGSATIETARAQPTSLLRW